MQNNSNLAAADFLKSCTLCGLPPDKRNNPSRDVLADLCLKLKIGYTSAIIDSVGRRSCALAVGDLAVALYGKQLVFRLAKGDTAASVQKAEDMTAALRQGKRNEEIRRISC